MRSELEAMPDVASITMHGASAWYESAYRADDKTVMPDSCSLVAGSEMELWPEWTWWPWPNPQNPILPPKGMTAETFCHLKRAFTGFRSTDLPAGLTDLDVMQTEIPNVDLNWDGKITMQEAFTYDTTHNSHLHCGGRSHPWLSDTYGLADEIVMLDYPNPPDQFDIELTSTPTICVGCHRPGPAIHWSWQFRPATENVDSFKTLLLDYGPSCMQCHINHYGTGYVEVLPHPDTVRWVHRIPTTPVSDSTQLVWDPLPLPRYTSNCPDPTGHSGYLTLLGTTSDNEYWTIDLDSGHTYHCAVQSLGALIRDPVGPSGPGTVFCTSERTDFEVLAYNGQSEPLAPQAFAVYCLPQTGELSFRWQPCGAGEYRVYSSPTAAGPFDNLVGAATGGTLTIPMPGDAMRFYIVRAAN